MTFAYKDRRDGDRKKTMSLAVVEFIRRFMTHLVPDHFMRIRHYGFLSNRSQKELLPLCKALIEGNPAVPVRPKSRRWYEVIEQLTGNDPLLCPHCGKGGLRVFEELPPVLAPAA